MNQRRNVAASVHARLRAKRRTRGDDFDLILRRYAGERFLYRLGQSPHRDRFVLKGAMLFALWGGMAFRPTRDLDFTGFGSRDAKTMLACFREICALSVEDDGVVFDAGTLTVEPIRDDVEYGGLRVQLRGKLGTADIAMKIDVGFGDAIEPPPTEVHYPTLLDFPAPQIRAYPREAVVAEKLHIIHRFGETNTRLKDYYDLHVLARQFPFEGQRLARAIAATFARRGSAIEPRQLAGLAQRFFSDMDRLARWQSYLSKNFLSGAPPDFEAVGELLRSFLDPPRRAVAAGDTFSSAWQPGGPWQVGSAKSSAEIEHA